MAACLSPVKYFLSGSLTSESSTINQLLSYPCRLEWVARFRLPMNRILMRLVYQTKIKKFYYDNSIEINHFEENLNHRASQNWDTTCWSIQTMIFLSVTSHLTLLCPTNISFLEIFSLFGIIPNFSAILTFLSKKLVFNSYIKCNPSIVHLDV